MKLKEVKLLHKLLSSFFWQNWERTWVFLTKTLTITLYLIIMGEEPGEQGGRDYLAILKAELFYCIVH